MTLEKPNYQWYALYTRANGERKLLECLQEKNIECYLPMKKVLKVWSDRKKWVEFPLLSGYCFVNITRREYDRVLRCANVVCYVTFEGKAAVIPEIQIDALRRVSKQFDFYLSVSHENFEPGQKVEVIAGPMIGARGELVKASGKHKFIIRLDELKSVVAIEIPVEHLTAIRVEM